MDKNLNYQQARRIRHTGFGGILADQLEQNSTITQAVKRTISLKMQSRVKGIQEKFDPLNIAKFMTFGSSWAPALLGKLTGRSHEDTRYFSGRLKPIVVKSSKKVTPLPKDGEQLVEGKNIRVSGINKQLMKVFNLLKKSEQADKKRREMESNFEEERAIEQERRHKEFIKALENLSVGGTATQVETEKPKSLMDQIIDYVGPLGWLTKYSALTGLFADIVPLMVAAFPMLALWKVTEWADKADINNPEGNPIAETARAGLDFATWYNKVTGRDERIQKEWQETKDRRMTTREPGEKVSASSESEQLKALAPSILHYEELYKKAKDDDKKQIEVVLNQLYDQRDALIEKIGGVKVEGERITPQKKTSATKVENKETTNKKVENNTTNVNNKTGDKVSNTENNTNTAVNTEMNSTTVQELTSKMSPVTNINEQTQQLMAATSQNMDAQLPKVKAEDNVTINNVVSSTKKQNQKLDSLSEIAVRNDEPSLLKIIMDSTHILS